MSSTETRLKVSTRAASSGWGERRGGGEKVEEMVVRAEMRGVVVGRNPGQSPGSHTRDSSQRHEAVERL